MRMRKMLVIGVCLCACVIGGCAHNSETDGSKEFALVHYKEDRKGKHNWSFGKGGWNHSPATSSMFGNKNQE